MALRGGKLPFEKARKDDGLTRLLWPICQKRRLAAGMPSRKPLAHPNRTSLVPCFRHHLPQFL